MWIWSTTTMDAWIHLTHGMDRFCNLGYGIPARCINQASASWLHEDNSCQGNSYRSEESSWWGCGGWCFSFCGLTGLGMPGGIPRSIQTYLISIYRWSNPLTEPRNKHLYHSYIWAAWVVESFNIGISNPAFAPRHPIRNIPSHHGHHACMHALCMHACSHVLKLYIWIIYLLNNQW